MMWGWCNVSPIGCILGKLPIRLGNSNRLPHLILPMHMWHILVLCWHRKLCKATMGLAMGCMAWHLVSMGLGIMLFRKHLLASQQLAGRKQWLIITKWHVGNMLCIRKHWLASPWVLAIKALGIMACMVGRKHRLAFPMWHLGTKLCMVGMEAPTKQCMGIM